MDGKYLIEAMTKMMMEFLKKGKDEMKPNKPSRGWSSEWDISMVRKSKIF